MPLSEHPVTQKKQSIAKKKKSKLYWT